MSGKHSNPERKKLKSEKENTGEIEYNKSVSRLHDVLKG